MTYEKFLATIAPGLTIKHPFRAGLAQIANAHFNEPLQTVKIITTSGDEFVVGVGVGRLEIVDWLEV